VSGENTEWQKATKSGGSGECVEMRRQDGMVQVRDSKNPNGAVLAFSGREITAWLDGAAKGEFDHLGG
jgi:hypothetical protein